MKCAEPRSFSNFDAVTALHSDDPEAAKRTVVRAMCRPICGDGVAAMPSFEVKGSVSQESFSPSCAT
jgi:hypothetical protein